MLNFKEGFDDFTSKLELKFIDMPRSW